MKITKSLVLKFLKLAIALLSGVGVGGFIEGSTGSVSKLIS